MKLIQPTLNNFANFKVLDLFGDTVRISEFGIIHNQRHICETCGSVCCYNGSSNKGRHALSRSTNSFFQKRQQYCPVCDMTIQVENKWLDNIIDSFNLYLASQIISLSENLSEDEIVKHFERTMSIIISKSTVHNIIKCANEELKNHEFKYEVADNFYAYDEQYLSINGKRAFRLVFFDLKNKKIIYEKIHERFSKKILMAVLMEVFGKTKPKGFVVDMRLEYPSAFESVFGKKIKVQFCVFHLNKLILKEYRGCLIVGNTVKWTLINYYYLYTLFNIFYDRENELKILRKMIDDYDNFKKNLTPEMIKKAQANAIKYRYNNVEFKLGDIEELPMGDNSINAIISNCVINLAPNKDKVFKEAFRVLKKGGKMFVSDIVLLGELTEEQKIDDGLLTGCVAGALQKDDYIKKMKKAGFNVKILGEDKDISKRQYEGIALESLKVEAIKQ